LPGAGVFTNYNTLLGSHGVIGIKTGSVTTGDLVFAAKHKVDGQTVTIYGAVLGVTPTAGQAQGLIAAATSDSSRLLVAVEKHLSHFTVVPKGTVEAQLSAPWLSSKVAVATASPLALLGWPGLKVQVAGTRSGSLSRGSPAGTAVGQITAKLGTQSVSSELRTTRSVPKPSLTWRLTRL
ncbi:MAG: hypothetical protein ACRDX8_05960, partial [Acidimicrobiales bacterium]